MPAPVHRRGIIPPPQARDEPAGGAASEGKAAAMTRVTLSSGFSRRYTGGEREFEIEATTLRGVIKELDRRYPGLGEHLEEETTVAIDGHIHDEPGYYQKLRPGSEVFFIPKLEGG